MKKTFSTTALAMGLSLLIGQVAFATPPINQSSPEAAIKGYLAAMKAGNVQLVQDYSKNVSFADAVSEANWIKDGLEIDPLLSYEIVSKSVTSADRVEYMVKEVHESQEDDYPLIPYTVTKENGKWSVLFELVEINRVKDSPDYGKVKVQKQKFHEQKVTSQETHPTAAISAVYWNFTGLMPSTTIYGADKFGQVRTDGLFTLNGWQQASSGVASVTYSVIKKIGNGYTTYIQKNYSGNYPKSATWFGSYEYSLPYSSSSDYQMMFTNNGYYSTDGSGNGYE
ncbi:hypothetical protein [Tumebacillus flagellatus]|uniref:DUF4878 domain-containing protein n=1 Tax=Tumebacillus flagellatus TaxID=1157490 RepID=A0A074LJV9_9BACL|nr:hypothetical protein [Tumebacillus flagellatus]KEO81394.1 hypothetical protein EL26_20885 [Tumebacillus flagellatus]